MLGNYILVHTFVMVYVLESIIKLPNFPIVFELVSGFGALAFGLINTASTNKNNRSSETIYCKNPEGYQIKDETMLQNSSNNRKKNSNFFNQTKRSCLGIIRVLWGLMTTECCWHLKHPVDVGTKNQAFFIDAIVMTIRSRSNE